MSEKEVSLFHHSCTCLHRSELQSLYQGSNAAIFVDFSSPFTSGCTAEIMYFSPLMKTVARSNAFRAVESPSSEFHWSGTFCPSVWHRCQTAFLLQATFIQQGGLSCGTCCYTLCLCPEQACAQMCAFVAVSFLACCRLECACVFQKAFRSPKSFFNMLGCFNAELITSCKVCSQQCTEDHPRFSSSVFAAAVTLAQWRKFCWKEFQTWLRPPPTTPAMLDAECLSCSGM